VLLVTHSYVALPSANMCPRAGGTYFRLRGELIRAKDLISINYGAEFVSTKGWMFFQALGVMGKDAPLWSSPLPVACTFNRSALNTRDCGSIEVLMVLYFLLWCVRTHCYSAVCWTVPGF
jgi:hypothetical protein